MAHGEITQAEMAAHLRAGEARPLLAGGIPGPMRFAGRWWAVHTDAEHYHPVTAAMAERLDDHARRLAAAAAAVDQAQRRTHGQGDDSTRR